MLAELLKKFQSGENLTAAEIAGQLDVSEAMVYMMSEELARQGYMEEVSQCKTACSACPESNGCAVEKTGRVWLLTQKGKIRHKE